MVFAPVAQDVILPMSKDSPLNQQPICNADQFKAHAVITAGGQAVQY